MKKYTRIFVLIFGLTAPVLFISSALVRWGDRVTSKLDAISENISAYDLELNSLFETGIESQLEIIDSKIDVIDDELSIVDYLTDSQLDTIQSKADTIIDNEEQYLGQSDVSGTTLTISAAGRYILMEDITALVDIATDNVTLDLNGHCVTGIIDGSPASYILIENGKALRGTGFDEVIFLNGSRNIVRNMVLVTPTATTAGSTLQFASNGSNNLAEDCWIIGGSATGNTANGGSGIVVNSASSTIRRCIVAGGDAGDSTTATAAGDGGNGITVGGAAHYSVVHDCIILKTGNGGDNSSSGNAGNGGHGIYIDSAASSVSVYNCIIRNTGTGGTAAGAGSNGTDGKAILDLSSTGTTVIWGNFADNISNTIKFDLSASGTEEGVVLSYPVKTSTTNMLVNYYIA